jgi:hypothetical protein
MRSTDHRLIAEQKPADAVKTPESTASDRNELSNVTRVSAEPRMRIEAGLEHQTALALPLAKSRHVVGPR